MILLENVNVVLREELLQQLRAGKPSPVDLKCADFDGVEYYLVNQGPEFSTFYLLLRAHATSTLMQNGGDRALSQVYGSQYSSLTPQKIQQLFPDIYARPPSPDREKLINDLQTYQILITFPMVGVQQADFEKFADKYALVKNHLFSAPIIERMNAALQKQTVPGIVDIQLRSQTERMWVQQNDTDRLTVTFSINFTDPDDVVFGSVFLKAFTQNVPNAPTVTFNPPNVPLELRGVSNLPIPLAGRPPVSYVTLAVYGRHWSAGKVQESAFTIITFRNYLHYHIKCCKSYLHTRMRAKVHYLLQLLNRARHDAPKEKKTATGKTFKK